MGFVMQLIDSNQVWEKETLGVIIAPDGSQKTLGTSLTEKAKDFGEKIKSS